MLVKNVMLYQHNVMIDVRICVACRWQYDILMPLLIREVCRLLQEAILLYTIGSEPLVLYKI